MTVARFSRSEMMFLTAQSLGFKYYGVPIIYYKDLDLAFAGNIVWEPLHDAHQAEQLLMEHEIILRPYRPNWWAAECFSRDLKFRHEAETPRKAVVLVTCFAQEAINKRRAAQTGKAVLGWDSTDIPVGVIPTRSPTDKEAGDAIKRLQQDGLYGSKVRPVATPLPNSTPRSSSSTSVSKSEKSTRRRPRKST